MSQKIVSQVRVRNPSGIHMRPATHIVKLLYGCKSKVFFTHKRETVNAKSLLSILMLAVCENAKVIITVEGIDAEETTSKLLKAFETNFEG